MELDLECLEEVLDINFETLDIFLKENLRGVLDGK